MQQELSVVVTRMDRAYNAIYGTHSPETRRDAEQSFFRRQDWLRQRGITFRQALDGKWALDYEGGRHGK
jgi:hypothetical protein